jgi:hypothetical protein
MYRYTAHPFPSCRAEARCCPPVPSASRARLFQLSGSAHGFQSPLPVPGVLDLEEVMPARSADTPLYAAVDALTHDGLITRSNCTLGHLGIQSSVGYVSSAPQIAV